jgi:hypothetical protein
MIVAANLQEQVRQRRVGPNIGDRVGHAAGIGASQQPIEIDPVAVLFYRHPREIHVRRGSLLSHARTEGRLMGNLFPIQSDRPIRAIERDGRQHQPLFDRQRVFCPDRPASSSALAASASNRCVSANRA